MSRPTKRTPNGIANGNRKITSFFQRRVNPPHETTNADVVKEATAGFQETMATDESRKLRDCVDGLTISGGNTSLSPTLIHEDSGAGLVSDGSLSSIQTPSPRAGSPLPLAEDSQQDIDIMDLDESDEELPSLETLFPTATESDPSVRRSSRHRSIPPVKQVAAAKPTSRQRSPDFSLAWLEKQREELDKRDAARARTQVMLNESIEDFDDPDADRMELDTENALGKDSSEKVKAALSKIGGDIGQEGGYRLFRHARKERKFDTAWIRGVEWLEGFDDDETRAEHIRYGFAKQMVDLGEKLHPELIIWFLEHIAFEQSQSVALAYSEMLVSALMKSAGFMTTDILHQIFFQFGADKGLLRDDSAIEITKENVDVECNKYGLIVLASILGSLAGSLPSETLVHISYLLMKMSMDYEYGPDLTETVEASLVPLLQSLEPGDVTELLNLLVRSVKDPSLQIHLLDRLPIYPASVAKSRQSLAKQFLNLSPAAPLEDVLKYLQTQYPFKELPRDVSNKQTQHIKTAMLIIDIAVSLPPPEYADITRKIIKELQYMHRSIIDSRVAFIMRTEAKEIIQRVWMRLDYSVNKGRRFRENRISAFYRGE